MQDHRDNQLQELKERIRRGQYVVDPQAIADAIVRRIGLPEASPYAVPVRLTDGHGLSRARRLGVHSDIEAVAGVAS
jgi:hypothetical protein